MKQVSLSGSLRENVGKKDAKKNRREGNVLCVLYGGKDQVHFVMPKLEFDKLIFTRDSYLVNLDIDGKSYQAVLQDVQYHPVTDIVLHADFLLVVKDKPITTAIPVNFEGNVPGVMAGGRLVKKMYKVIVRGMIDDMPDFITVDMSNLKIGQSVKINDLKLENLECQANGNSVIVMVKTARAVVDIEDEEEDEEGEEGEKGESTEEAATEA